MSHIKAKQAIEEPKRLQYATDKINELGFDVHKINNSVIHFYFNDNLIKVFVYSGWFTGKGIKDGRGIDNLLKQLRNAIQ